MKKKRNNNILYNIIISNIVLVISIYSIIGILLYIWFYEECKEVYLS